MIIPYEPKHLEGMEVTAAVQTVLNDANAVAQLEYLASSGLVGTIVTPDDVILGVTGALPLSPKVWEVFVVSAEARKLHPIEFAKSVREVLTHIRAHAKIVQATGEDTPVLRRWFKWLGFDCKGPVSPESPKLLWSMAGTGGN